MCTAQDRMALQREIKTTQNITGSHLLSISDVQSPKDAEKGQSRPRPVHSAASWQEMMYHQTTEQLLSSGASISTKKSFLLLSICLSIYRILCVSNIKRLDLWFNFLNANKWTLYMKEIQLKWKALKTCFKIYKNRSKSNMCLFSTKIFTYPVLLFLPRWKIQNLLKLIKSY